MGELEVGKEMAAEGEPNACCETLQRMIGFKAVNQ